VECRACILLPEAAPNAVCDQFGSMISQVLFETRYNYLVAGGLEMCGTFGRSSGSRFVKCSTSERLIYHGCGSHFNR